MGGRAVDAVQLELEAQLHLGGRDGFGQNDPNRGVFAAPAPTPRAARAVPHRLPAVRVPQLAT
jgi:hypothetical protein